MTNRDDNLRLDKTNEPNDELDALTSPFSWDLYAKSRLHQFALAHFEEPVETLYFPQELSIEELFLVNV